MILEYHRTRQIIYLKNIFRGGNVNGFCIIALRPFLQLAGKKYESANVSLKVCNSVINPLFNVSRK
jgi:hypothetical protein